MESKVIIYGTDGCPFVKKALQDYGKRAVFYNVQTNPERLQEMFVFSKGERNVPVIVENEKVTIGYGGS